MEMTLDTGGFAPLGPTTIPELLLPEKSNYPNFFSIEEYS
jgi:hypothetical protein